MARIKAVQESTLDGAARRGFQWTGPELEVAAREDLTSREVASMLGRTLYGVTQIRRKLGRDPRKARLAGLDTEVAEKGRP